MDTPRTAALNLWHVSEVTERRKIVNNFIRTHGDTYTYNDFLLFLEKEYRIGLNAYLLPPPGEGQLDVCRG